MSIGRPKSKGFFLPCNHSKVAKPNSRSKAHDGRDKDSSVERIETELDASLVRLGQQLKALRKQRRVTQQALEKRTGLSQGAQSKIENGDRALHLRSLLKYAIGMQMQPSELAMLLDWGPRANATDRSLVEVPVIIGPGVNPETVKELRQELAGRGAKIRHLVGKRR